MPPSARCSHIAWSMNYWIQCKGRGSLWIFIWIDQYGCYNAAVLLVVEGSQRRMMEEKMASQKDNTLAIVRNLSKESHAGLLFCYKALKKFGYDPQKTLAYLKSEEFKTSFLT